MNSKSKQWGSRRIVLCSHSTPQAYLNELHSKHVDLKTALEELNTRFGVKRVRVDSGGVLNGVLLRAGLVDEVSILIDPALVGGTSPRSIFTADDLTSLGGVVKLKLTHLENVKNDSVWLKYEVVK